MKKVLYTLLLVFCGFFVYGQSADATKLLMLPAQNTGFLKQRFGKNSKFWRIGQISGCFFLKKFN